MQGSLVSPSIRPSVYQMHGLWQNGRQTCPDFYTIQKIIQLSLLRRMIGGGRPLLPEILGQLAPIRVKSPILKRYTLVAPEL